MSTSNPKTLALASSACITAALLLGVSALFAVSAHAGEVKMASTSVSQKSSSRAALNSFDPQVERVTASR